MVLREFSQEQNNLELVYQGKTAAGRQSNFNMLIGTTTELGRLAIRAML